MKLRSIETAESKSKKDRNRNVAIGLTMVILMVLSTWGYALNSEKKDEKMKYRDFVFLRTDQGWQLQTPFSITTLYNPREVEHIPCNLRTSRNEFIGQNLYVDASNINEKSAAYEIAKNLQVSRMQSVCIEGDENKTGCEELPIKNCYDDKVLIVREIRTEENITANPKIYQQAKCIILEAASENMTMAADRTVFFLYGVI